MNRQERESDGASGMERANKRMKRQATTGPSAAAATNNEPIRSPRFQDVLCGRGGKSNKWPGNVIYRQVVQRNKDHYQSTEMPHHKGFIVISIIEAIHRQCPPGRFLRFDKASNTWKEISRKEAFSKTSQALREQDAAARKPEQSSAAATATAVVDETELKIPAKANPTMASSLVPPESIESRIEPGAPSATTTRTGVAAAASAASSTTEEFSTDTTAAMMNPTNNFIFPKPAAPWNYSNMVDFSTRDTKRPPAYGIPSRVPLDDDDDDDENNDDHDVDIDFDSVVLEFDKEFDYSQEARLNKCLAAGLRPLQIHIGLPYIPSATGRRSRCSEEVDDYTAIVSTGQRSNDRSSCGSEDEEDESLLLEDDAYGIPPLPGCKMRAPSMTELLQREDSLAFENAIYQI